MKALGILIFVFMIQACATTEKYEAVLNTWIGHSAEQLVSSWGYPVRIFRGPNGNEVYQYDWSNNVVMPTQSYTTVNAVGNTAYANTTTSGGGVIGMSCSTYFELNEEKKVVTWRYKGNRCVTY